MSKPEDVPQDVWDEALRQWRIGRGFGTIDIIARAILAERERCAKVCEEAERQCLAARNEYPVKSELRLLNQGAMTLARDLAAAIRKGGSA